MNLKKIFAKYKLSIIFIIFGLLIILFPSLVNYFDWPIFNVDKIVSSKYRIIFGSIICIIAVIFFLFEYRSVHKIALIIIDGFDGQKLEEYRYHGIKKIDVHRYTLECNKTNRDEISNVVINIDHDFEKYMYGQVYDEFIFEGISLIPFVFYLGMKYGDDNKKYSFIHSFRKRKNDLRKLKKTNKKESVNLIVNDEKMNCASKDLIVKVATSFPMNENMDDYFKNMDVLSINSSKYGVDIIDNETLLDNWANQIINEIRKYSDKYDKIHLFLNTCTCMVFKLGTILNNNYDTCIKVYDYNRKSSILRPWSISNKDYKKVNRIVMTPKRK